MEIEQTTIDDVSVLEIHGSILGGREVRPLVTRLAELARAGKYKVVLDLADVNWVNLAGLGTLIGAFAMMRNHKGALRLARATGHVQELLASTNTVDILQHYGSVQDAVTSFK